MWKLAMRPSWRSLARYQLSLIYIVFNLAFPRPCSGGSKTSFFELSANVQELNMESFKGIANLEEPWAINCYSPGCPHCKHFAPTWEQIGAALRDSAVHIGAVNCVKHRDLCQKLKVGSYPSLMALNYSGAPPGCADDPAVKLVKTGGGGVDKVLSIISAAFSTELDSIAVVRGLDALEGDSVIAPSTSKAEEFCALRLEDAAASVRWALENEIFAGWPDLSEERIAALLSFLDMLATTFPGHVNRERLRGLAAELRRDPSLNNSDRWQDRVRSLQIGNLAPSDELNWPVTNVEKGTEPNTNHYTNGLWALFHALSVSSAPTKQKPHEIMEGIRSFVDYFFRCGLCREHFLEMYKTCDNDRCRIPTPSSIRSKSHRSEGEAALALWVWRTHNAVNSRLAQETAKDIRKSLWPKVEACPECWSGFPQTAGEPPWSETAVLKFLKATYSCPNVVKEGMSPDSTGHNWALTCVAVCVLVSLLMRARRRQEVRFVGLDKKRVDAIPSV